MVVSGQIFLVSKRVFSELEILSFSRCWFMGSPNYSENQ